MSASGRGRVVVRSKWAWVGDDVIHAFPSSRFAGWENWDSFVSLCGVRFGALNGVDARTEKRCKKCAAKRRGRRQGADGESKKVRSGQQTEERRKS